MVQYYTLQEAAARLHITAEQLKDMAKKNEIRAFQDRGNLRFRAQEIDELARSRGYGSDPELPLGDEAATVSEPKSGPKSPSPKSPSPKATKTTAPTKPPTDADFSLSVEPAADEVPIGLEPPSSAGKNTPRTPGTRSPNPKVSGPVSPSPRPKAGSDSDVRLVGAGSELEFQIEGEPKVEKSPVPGPKTPGGSKKSSKIETAADSGVRIVPLDEPSDSDVKIVPDDKESDVPLGQAKSKTPSDSDIRLEEAQVDSGKGKRDEKGFVTEEIDLDSEELKALQETAKRQTSAKPKPRDGGSSGQLPKLSPFELSDPDVKVEPKTTSKKPTRQGSKAEVEKKKKDEDVDSSSDFDLALPKEAGSSPLELGSDEITPLKLDDSDEEVGLGELTGPGGGKSGINLKDPVDSGISLEQGGSDEMELEMPLEGAKTPKPEAKTDSSSEFELSLDDSDSSSEEEEGSSSSEFELTLDEGSSPGEEGSSSEFELSLDLESSSSEEMENLEADSDSEFELTIDDSGGLGPMEEEAALQEEDKDIFETDFEVPALEEESGSEAVALDEGDTDLDEESSDFDLSVDEDSETDSESASEVVALDEEEAEEAEEGDRPAKKKKPGGRTAVLEEEEEAGDFEDLEAEVEEEEEEEGAVAAAPAAPAEWGIIPVLFMTPCAFLMIFVLLLSFETMTSLWGYHNSSKPSSLLVDPLARMVYGDKAFPKD